MIPSGERRARLGVRHHLSVPADDAETVAADLSGIHSSDPASVYLAAWARVKDFRVEDLERALYDMGTDGSLARSAASRTQRGGGLRRTGPQLPVHLRSGDRPGGTCVQPGLR